MWCHQMVEELDITGQLPNIPRCSMLNVCSTHVILLYCNVVSNSFYLQKHVLYRMYNIRIVSRMSQFTFVQLWKWNKNIEQIIFSLFFVCLFSVFHIFLFYRCDQLLSLFSSLFLHLRERRWWPQSGSEGKPSTVPSGTHYVCGLGYRRERAYMSMVSEKGADVNPWNSFGRRTSS